MYLHVLRVCIVCVCVHMCMKEACARVCVCVCVCMKGEEKETLGLTQSCE